MSAESPCESGITVVSAVWDAKYEAHRLAARSRIKALIFSRQVRTLTHRHVSQLTNFVDCSRRTRVSKRDV